jgi:hypothetical protein
MDFQELKNNSSIEKLNKKKSKPKKKREKRPHDPEYDKFVEECKADGIQPMHYKQWKKSVRPQDPNLKRWKGARTAPSLWEKRDRDPAYASNTRGTLGTAWGIGRPKGPKGS